MPRFRTKTKKAEIMSLEEAVKGYHARRDHVCLQRFYRI